MDSDEKHILIRILETATGMFAVVAIVIFASAAGVNAYLAFQPDALEAQAIRIAQPQPIMLQATATPAHVQDVWIFPATSSVGD